MKALYKKGIEVPIWGGDATLCRLAPVSYEKVSLEPDFRFRICISRRIISTSNNVPPRDEDAVMLVMSDKF